MSVLPLPLVSMVLFGHLEVLLHAEDLMVHAKVGHEVVDRVGSRRCCVPDGLVAKLSLSLVDALGDGGNVTVDTKVRYGIVDREAITERSGAFSRVVKGQVSAIVIGVEDRVIHDSDGRSSRNS